MKLSKDFTSISPSLISERSRNILTFCPSQRRNRDPEQIYYHILTGAKLDGRISQKFHGRGIKIEELIRFVFQTLEYLQYLMYRCSLSDVIMSYGFLFLLMVYLPLLSLYIFTEKKSVDLTQ